MKRTKEIGYELLRVVDIDGFMELWNRTSTEAKDEIVNGIGELAVKLVNSIDADKEGVNIPVVIPRFDVERKDLYECDKPKERTRRRLTEMAECGMEEAGFGSFGYKGVMSGLYIEKVWGYSDEDFKDYMDWAKGLIATSLK